MHFHRRTFLAGGAALALAGAAGPARASAGTRAFALYRGGTQIGTQSLTVARGTDAVRTHLTLAVRVQVFGLTVYRYDLDAREEWRDGRLAAAEATTNANGTRMSMQARRDGDALVVDGTAFSGRVRGNPTTTSYWNPTFLSHGIWIDLEDGRPLRVTTRNLGRQPFPTTTGSVDATRWRVDGEADPVDLFFDAAGEWVGTEFEAQGETARLVVADRGPPLLPLWQAG
jgi:hypothetical protein